MKFDMTTVLILNGPNLNLLGTREPQVYGDKTLADVEALCQRACAANGFVLDFRQSNHEGVLVDWLHEAGRAYASGSLAGVILNAGAYTHTSVALLDALNAAERPTVEVHLSNIYKRERFRHHSYISPAAIGVIAGLGTQGYLLALQALARLLVR